MRANRPIERDQMAVFLPFVHGNDTFSASSMERTEKKSQGRTVVIGILFVATIAAALTWLRYTSQAPSTANAHLISEGLVLAKFPSNVARQIRLGSKAIVTFETSPSKRLVGRSPIARNGRRRDESGDSSQRSPDRSAARHALQRHRRYLAPEPRDEIGLKLGA